MNKFEQWYVANGGDPLDLFRIENVGPNQEWEKISTRGPYRSSAANLCLLAYNFMPMSQEKADFHELGAALIRDSLREVSEEAKQANIET